MSVTEYLRAMAAAKAVHEAAVNAQGSDLRYIIIAVTPDGAAHMHSPQIDGATAERVLADCESAAAARRLQLGQEKIASATPATLSEETRLPRTVKSIMVRNDGGDGTLGSKWHEEKPRDPDACPPGCRYCGGVGGHDDDCDTLS